MKLVVVAQYKEDCTWAEHLPEGWNSTVIQKVRDIPNWGREPSTFLWFITQLYDRIQPEDQFVFVQGNPFDHCPTLLNLLTEFSPNGYTPLGIHHHHSNAQGGPTDGHLPVAEFYEKWFKQPFPGGVDFVAGGQFAVTGKNILQHKKELYEEMLQDMQEGRNCYAMERLWSSLFKERVEE